MCVMVPKLYTHNRAEFHRSVVSLLAVVNMAGTIKLFQFIRKYHQAIGIFQTPANRQRSTVFLICSVQYMVTTIIFLAVEAKSMFDYGFAFFISVSATNTTIIYILFMWQLENTVTFIQNCEGLIEKRNLHSL